MTNEAERLMTEALRRNKLSESFCPVEVGRKIGLDKLHAEAAARALSNAGVLVLGFDFAAQFTSQFRKSRTRIAPKKASSRN
jgi:DTW domain-containing protein YfiP